jgi:FtsP/CotA-like multicopper oxidase with cupredoxin domain
MITRRSFIGAAAALGATAVLPASPVAAASLQRLVAGKRTIEVAGRAAGVYGLTNKTGSSGLVLQPRERFSVELVNHLDQRTIVHWHGQTPPPDLDGVADTGYVGPLAAGEARPFDFDARPGTHWMHAHHKFQDQMLLTAPLIVLGDSDIRADLQEVTLLLNDFSFRHPIEIFEGLTGGLGMDHGDGGHGGGHSMHQMDLNDVEYDAFLANDRTLDDPMVVRTERNGRVRLRIINAAASTAFWIDLEGHQATVLAVDGNAVRPVMGTVFPLAQAQRLDLLVDVAAGALVPVFARREGDVARTGLILAAPDVVVPRFTGIGEVAAPVDLSLEVMLEAAEPLSQKTAAVRHWVMLTGGMSPYEWTLNDRGWGRRHRLKVGRDQRVEIGFRNTSMMAHPMHLHGHHFHIIKVNGRAVAGAMRDTVLVPPGSTVVVAFDANNPGRWLYHCHNLYHMMAGMMSEVIYADEPGPDRDGSA